MRLGPDGDGPKVGCATCHKGTFKPLYGVSPLTDYRVLAGVVPPAPPASGAVPAAAPPAKVSLDGGTPRQPAATAMRVAHAAPQPPLK